MQVFKERLSISAGLLGGVKFLAQKTGIPRSTFSYYLSGKTQPRVDA